MKAISLCLFSLFIVTISSVYAQQQVGEKIWLETNEFNVQSFVQPALKYAPFTRWWWPGNDVKKEELKREVKLFVKNHFGGVEIQPFALVMPTKGAGRADRIMGYDTPFYYENLKFILEEALKNGLTVDLTDGSGWPAGGPHLTEDDNNLALEYGITDIPNNNGSPVNVPRPISNDHLKAKLVALLAVKIVGDTTSTDHTWMVDRKSVIDLTAKVKDSTFSYIVKEGQWKAIACWSAPGMEKPMLIAKKDAGLVMNHFDSLAILKNYDYLFGNRTGLQPYFGKSLRAIFDDSYEFKVNRHFSDDFIKVFSKNRGYDITKFLPANIWPGYNNMYYRMSHPGQQVIFSFNDEDWRLRYDYDLTLSDLIGTHFLQTTKNWTETRGLLHRTQAYGFNMDIMASAGLASIPEMETMQFNKGSEGGYKLISSGAHLYNRPVISSESVVYINRAFLTTPQKLKMTFDKLLASGVNQIIYHGTAYRYFPDGYPKDGWSPFYNSPLGINFSDNFNESNPFWKYLKPINEYTQRAQYVLRSGQSHGDILIYYPFLNYTEAVGNPKEVLLNGVIEDVEPPLRAENPTSSYTRPIESEWVEKIWPLLNELNANGIAWDWINDASIQQMRLTDDKLLDVRGNIYQSIVLFDLPYIQLASAKNLNVISKKGANILAIGELPKIQPSYFNYVKKDKQTAKEIIAVLKSKSATHITSLKELGKWKADLMSPIKYVEENDAFRQARRKMQDGSYVQFIWNESDEWQTLSVSVTHNDLKYVYWLNAEDGSIALAVAKNGVYEYEMGPFSSVFLLAQKDEITPTLITKTDPFDIKNAALVAVVKSWDIRAGSVEITNTPLFDWKENEQLKYSSDEASYLATFDLPVVEADDTYFIDFGKVCYSAEVAINGQPVKKLIYTPFLINATPYLKQGKNQITVKVTPSKYNNHVGQAVNGEKLYKKLKDAELTSEGLIGPVQIYRQK